MSFKFYSISYGVSACALGAVLAGPVWAQDTGPSAEATQLEEIIVTAQRRGESLQRVPISVTALNAASLQARNLREIGDLSTAVPGLQVGVAQGSIQPFLRGIGNPVTTAGNESSVGLYIDGVYYTRLPAGFFSLANIERIEVLKGPQGTLFGRNSSGGVIQIVTKDPSHTPSVQGSISYGNFDTVEGNLYAASGLGETLAADISISGRRQDDGFGRNRLTGGRASFTDYFSMKSKLLFEPQDGTRITISPSYTYSKAGVWGSVYPGFVGGYLTQPLGPRPGTGQLGYYDQISNFDPYAKSKSWGVSGKIEHQLENVQITSITAYTKFTLDTFTDSDFTERNDFTVHFGGNIKQFTQEFQAASLPGSPLTWIVGLFYYNTLTTYTHQEFRSPSGNFAAQTPGLNGFAQQRSKSYAGYAQATYEILPKLSLTAGVRYTEDRTSAKGHLDRNTTPPVRLVTPPPSSTSTNKLTFRGAVDYQAAPGTLLYGSFSRGYKSAVYNLLTYNPNAAEPEVVDTFELGMKADLFDRRVRLNAAVFHNKIARPQVQLIQGSTNILANAKSARTQGAEFEIQAKVAEGLTARAGGTYLDAEYRSYTDAPSGPPNPNAPFGAVSPLIRVDASGNRLPQAAKFVGNIGFDYTMTTGIGKWQLTADYFYNSGFYWEPDNLLRQKRYGLLSGQIRYSPTERLAIRLWGKNLTDKKYATRANTTAGPAGYPFIPAAPRTYGVALDFNL